MGSGRKVAPNGGGGQTGPAGSLDRPSRVDTFVPMFGRRSAAAQPIVRQVPEGPAGGALSGIQAGDPNALQELLDRYWRPLLRYASRLVDSDDAQDLVQEAFVRLWERRATWRPEASPRVLLYTIVRNLAFNHRKSAAVRGRSDLMGRLPRPAGTASPLDLLNASELDQAIEAAIAGLPPRRREVLLLARYHDLSRAEIAELLELSPQTVANHLGLAIAALKDRLTGVLAD